MKTKQLDKIEQELEQELKAIEMTEKEIEDMFQSMETKIPKEKTLIKITDDENGITIERGEINDFEFIGILTWALDEVKKEHERTFK